VANTGRRIQISASFCMGKHLQRTDDRRRGAGAPSPLSLYTGERWMV
jgi:hypothetical protein